MQVFLPCADFEETARCLDMRRLGKQRVEGLQILHACLKLLHNEKLSPHEKAIINHPVTLLWRNHLHTLCNYQIAICKEWIERGYKDTCLVKTINIQTYFPEDKIKTFLVSEHMCMRYRQHLMHKLQSHYGQYFNVEPREIGKDEYRKWKLH